MSLSFKIKKSEIRPNFTASEVSKYGVTSGPYFPVFGLNTGKYGPETPPYLDTSHSVFLLKVQSIGNDFIILQLFQHFNVSNFICFFMYFLL